MECLASPLVPVSWGELLDKISILEIKQERIARAEALANVTKEHRLLARIAAEAFEVPGVAERFRALKHVNEALWQIEDAIREEDAAGQFGATFVSLARSVYHKNDLRAAIKREINTLLRSELVEEKSYASFAAAAGVAAAPELIAEPVR